MGVTKEKKKRHIKECEHLNKSSNPYKPNEEEEDEVATVDVNSLSVKGLPQADSYDLSDLSDLSDENSDDDSSDVFDRPPTSNSKPPNSRSFRRVGPEL